MKLLLVYIVSSACLATGLYLLTDNFTGSLFVSVGLAWLVCFGREEGAK